VLDGEIVVASKGRVAALRARLHPAASRVERLRRETPAFFVAFDLLALGGDDLRELPFGERRRLLADLFASTRPTLHLTALTGDRERAARWLER
jgi:ATP-dependent DNA ligase